MLALRQRRSIGRTWSTVHLPMLTRHLAAVLALAAVSTAHGEPASPLAPLTPTAPSTARTAARESPALPLDEALAEIRGKTGAQFCPRCVAALERILPFEPIAGEAPELTPPRALVRAS